MDFKFHVDLTLTHYYRFIVVTKKGFVKLLEEATKFLPIHVSKDVKMKMHNIVLVLTLCYLEITDLFDIPENWSDYNAHMKRKLVRDIMNVYCK